MISKYHFNRKELIHDIEIAIHEKNSQTSFKQKLLPILKKFIDEHSENIKNIYMENKDGVGSGELRSKMIDAVILTAFDAINNFAFPIANPTTSDKLAVITVGGYGRGNLSPGSDIDLLILTPYKMTPRIEKIVETLLYLLWDLKLKVGYAVRSLEETIVKARAITTICTTLLDANLYTAIMLKEF